MDGNIYETTSAKLGRLGDCGTGLTVTGLINSWITEAVCPIYVDDLRGFFLALLVAIFILVPYT